MSTAVQRQQQKVADKLSTPEHIQAALGRVFQDSQSSVAGHRKQVNFLKAILRRSIELGHEESFHYFFCKLINRVLVVKKSETVGDRVVKLVASFILSLQEDYAKDEGDEEEEADDNPFTRFVHIFITHLLRGIESKDKNVRYRVVQFLDYAMSGLGEIDDTLYETLMWSLDRRLHDKEPTVRIKALHCIARFQESDQAEETDEVDEATGKLLTAIQNDPSAEVRRAALLNLIKTPLTKHYLLERAKDTNLVNRRLVYSRIMKELGDFRTIDAKTREKLLSWGLKDREETVRKACIKMFSQDWLNTVDGDLIELLERLHITHSDVAELAMKEFFKNRKDILSKITFPAEIWTKLTPEISFLARSFYSHCFENTLSDLIDANYPESAELANLLARYLETRKQLESLDDAEDLDFVIEQLLQIAVNYDFSDEIGRRAMLHVIRSSLSNDRLSEKLIKVALQVLLKLSISEKDFCGMVTECITDVRDSDLEQNEGEEEHESESNILHSLTICKAMLQLANEPLKDNLSVESLIDTLINPSVRNTQSTIRELGTEALGLCCLLDLKLATDQLYLFGLCLSKGHEDLRIIAVKAIFDILSVHGTKVLDVEDGVDSLSFHKLLYRTLRNDDLPKLQAIAAEGLCKLYLADILHDEELFETLLLTYYDPSNCDNQSLLQAFTFCLPVYCFSHPQHQEKMSKVAADAFKRLYVAHIEDLPDDEDMVSPATLLQQLVHWTNPENVVNQNEEKLESSLSHLNFGIDLLNVVSESHEKKYRKLIFQSLPKLYIGTGIKLKDLVRLHEAIDSVEDILEEQDSVAKNAVKKLLAKIEPLIVDARAKEKEVINDEDREYSIILEHQDEDEEQKQDEVDEEFEQEQSMVLYSQKDNSDKLDIDIDEGEQKQDGSEKELEQEQSMILYGQKDNSEIGDNENNDILEHVLDESPVKLMIKRVKRDGSVDDDDNESSKLTSSSSIDSDGDLSME